ncbi:MAG: FAD binding domain-containing protein [Spirochaetaceae bacterium]|nr:FAD binding domain-containing protein [Spirochaetaceae bacterium]
MEIGHYERPRTLDEAYRLIVGKGGFPLGGGAWAHLNVRSVDMAVDLCDLKLRYLREAADEDEDSVEIGAMTTARDLETSPLLESAFRGAFRHATEHLVGVQLRNLITIGGTVVGRYGFSDLITLLLTLDAKVCFYNGGRLRLGDFLASSPKGPFLLEKILVAKNPRVSFQSLRITRNDFAILNAAAAFAAGEWRIAVGARPASARLCPEAAAAMKGAAASSAPLVELATLAAKAAASETVFGTDSRGSADYRRLLSEALVKRAILEAS